MSNSPLSTISALEAECLRLAGLVDGEQSVTLLCKGKKITDDASVRELSASATILMIISKELKPVDTHLLPRIIDDATYSTSKVIPKNTTLLNPRFGGIQTLEGLPFRDKAREILLELANDTGIIAIMNKHDFHVGALAELFPEGEVGISEVCVLGLNENKGQRILLRLRTDDLAGFRHIHVIKKTLIHELTHNVWGDHDQNFYMLMRQLEKECVELDWTKSKGNRTDGNSGSTYSSSNVIQYMTEQKPKNQLIQDTGPRVLGTGDDDEESDNVWRALPASYLASQAAIMRLTREEQEIEDACVSTMVYCQPCDELVTGTSAIGANEDKKEAASDKEDHDGTEEEEKDVMQVFDDKIKGIESSPGDKEEEQQSGDGNEVRDYDSMNASDEYDPSYRVDDIFEHIDCCIINCFEMQQSSMAEKLSNIRDAIERIIAHTVPSASTTSLVECLKLLNRIVGNAQQDVNKRELNGKGSVASKLLSIDGTDYLLKSIGFQATADSKLKLVALDSGLLYVVREILDKAIEIFNQT